eukprot:scaffold300_cov258-Pinguiococcus_pyrenoidosus.AAC.64
MAKEGLPFIVSDWSIWLFRRRERQADGRTFASVVSGAVASGERGERLSSACDPPSSTLFTAPLTVRAEATGCNRNSS